MPRLALLILIAVASGCSEPAAKTFKVTGIVRFAQKPIPDGSVTFEDSQTGFAETFPLLDKGQYEAIVPEGSFQVSVQPPMRTVKDMKFTEGGDEFMNVEYVPVKYWSAYESGLTVQVSGDTKYDIDMVRGAR